ncbi:peptidoglycan hydrolase CwlO-like protein [Neomicrococcus aestuarii]|uniref:Peptidoglycan hydrolase CwlO-like protein n=1 Tax=Neomicrococcus aestuarii TaxID=556325 RepID=A0A7W8TXV7_9MICC|nr:hypothetical protein [Neomicrococcus aestuarii]MBB5513496.1 peptidoglycan hydrolase CwlO-like protein [Neomicrococcus aestuarii]
MSETLIISIVAGILTIFGGAGFWSYKASRAETPLKQGAHDLALAAGVNQIMMASLEAVQEDAKELREDLKSLRDELETVKTELDSERKNFTTRLERWVIWYQQLAVGWEVHRQKPHAPPPPDNLSA